METKRSNSELRALLSIRNFGKALETHYSQMIQIEKSLDDLNANATTIIEAHAPVHLQQKWKLGLMNVNSSISAVNETLNKGKQKVSIKDRSGSIELWKKFDQNIIDLKQAYKDSENIGLEILPDTEREHWQNDISNFEDIILPIIIAHANSCKIELQMIEKYTPKELNKITQIIFDHIPEDFTFEDADKYESDYLKAIEEFKKEFSEEKNLWDKFLDVLAGGTHQPPSERVMMERWLEGEKQDL